MAEDIKQDQGPDGVRAVPTDEDTEGHRRVPNAVPDAGPDGVRAVPTDADTEGHRRI